MFSNSNFVHISIRIFSVATSLETFSPRHKITLLALSIIFVFSDCDKVADIFAWLFKAFTHFCWIKIAFVFTFYRLKLLFLENFSMSRLVPMVINWKICSVSLKRRYLLWIQQENWNKQQYCNYSILAQAQPVFSRWPKQASYFIIGN